MSVRLKLKISVTTEPIETYSSGYIPIGPVVVLNYFLWGVGHPPPKKKNVFWGTLNYGRSTNCTFLLSLGAKP